MHQMKFLSKPQPSKAIQANDFDADMNLRKDAFLIGHQRDLAEDVSSPTKHRARGRKNRFSKAIDHEDFKAEDMLLAGRQDSDAGIVRELNELLDKEAPLETKR